MITTYTYSVSADTLNGVINTFMLTQAISSSAIVTALERIDVSGDAVDVVFKAALSGGDEALLGGLLEAHDGAPSPVIPDTVTLSESRDETGVVRFSPSNKLLAESTRYIGYEWEAAPGVTNIFDLEVAPATIYLAGAQLVYGGGVTKGDYMEFSIVDKNDVLGMFGMYGLTPGVDVIELQKYVKTYHAIPALIGVPIKIESDALALLASGLFMRMYYVSVGTEPVDLNFWYHWLEV